LRLGGKNIFAAKQRKICFIDKKCNNSSDLRLWKPCQKNCENIGI
jgi:hypothetical protein